LWDILGIISTCKTLVSEMPGISRSSDVEMMVHHVTHTIWKRGDQGKVGARGQI